MEFFDQVKKTAADVAQKVAKKSNELVEVSKIKYEIYDLNADIKKLYAEIGKQVYAQMKDSDALPEDVMMKCEIIEAKYAKMEALKRKDKDMKQQMTCPVCKKECKDAEDVCPYCGADLAVSVDAEVIHEEN